MTYFENFKTTFSRFTIEPRENKLPVFLLAIICSLSDRVYSCGISEAKSCFSNVKEGTVLDETGLKAIPTKAQLDNICRKRKDFESCFQDKFAGCYLKNPRTSLTASFSYRALRILCSGNGKENIEKYNSCWEKPKLKFETCYENLKTALTSAALRGYSEWCRLISSTIDCIRKTTVDDCNAPEGCFVHSLLTMSVEDAFNHMACVKATPCVFQSRNETTGTGTEASYNPDSNAVWRVTWGATLWGHNDSSGCRLGVASFIAPLLALLMFSF